MSEKQTIKSNIGQEYNYAGALPAENGTSATDYGFSLDTLPVRGESAPLDTVVASSDELLKDIHENELIRLIDSPDNVDPGEELINIYASLNLKLSKINKRNPGLAEKLAGKRFLSDSEIAESGILDEFSDEIKEAMQDAIVKRMLSEYDTDFVHIPSEILNNNPSISQVFEFTSDGKVLRLYNFSETKITTEQLAKVTNAIREMSQVTGGLVFDRVPVMVIAPSSSSRFSKVSEGAKAVGGSSVNAYALGTGTVVFNEQLLKEKTPTTDDNFSVGGNDIEYVTFHELAHAISKPFKGINPEAEFARSVGWDFETNDIGYIENSKQISSPDVKAPSRYGRVALGEDLAESATARFAGGGWEDAVSQDRKDAIKKLYESVHSGFIGPIHIACKELDLGKSKIGLKYNGSKVAILPHININLI